MSPEEAEAFLASQRLKRKTKDIPAPPKNLSSADLNDWYGQQRQRDLEERRKREEAEAYLRGYRADFVESNNSKESHNGDHSTYSYPPIKSKGSMPDAKSHIYTSPSKEADAEVCEGENEIAEAIIVEEVVDCTAKIEEKIADKNDVAIVKDNISEKTSDLTVQDSPKNDKESEDNLHDVVNAETVIIATELTNDTAEEIVDKASDSIDKASTETTAEIEEKVATEVDAEKNVTTSEELTKSLIDNTASEVETNVDVKENEDEDVIAAEELIENNVKSWSSWICEGMFKKLVKQLFLFCWCFHIIS